MKMQSSIHNPESHRSFHSMILKHVHEGSLILYEIPPTPNLESSSISVIEKIGDEGLCALALKKVVIKRQTVQESGAFSEDIDWNDQEIELRSYNTKIKTWILDPQGEYRYHGHFLRAVQMEKLNLEFVDADDLLREVYGQSNREPDESI